MEAAEVRSEPVLVGGRRAAFLVLTALLLVAVGGFARYWFTLPDVGTHRVLYAAATFGVFYLIGVWTLPWLAMARMQAGARNDLARLFAGREDRCIVGALRVSLKTADALDFERNAPRDVRAYDFYLRGRQLQAMKSTFTWTAAPEMFRRAIELDPEYAQAHAGLARRRAGKRIARRERVVHDDLGLVIGTPDETP